MSYGGQLDEATTALAQVAAALRGQSAWGATSPWRTLDAQASAAVARMRLYHSLAGQIQIVGPQMHAGRWFGPAAAADTAGLERYLEIAASTTTQAAARLGGLDPVGPVAAGLHAAAQAVRAAGDILVTNTGPHRLVGVPRPLTSEGMAVLSGVGRADNLALLAALAATAAAMDRKLCEWFDPPPGPEDLRRLVVAAAQRDTRRETELQVVRRVSGVVSRAGDPSQAPLRDLRVAPPVDDPRRWSRLGGAADCVQAVDAARTWLVRRGEKELTIGQLGTAARAAQDITSYIRHVRAYTAPVDGGTEELAAATRRWRAVWPLAAGMRSPAAAAGDRSTLPVALTAAAGWLAQRLRPDGRWADPARWAPDQQSRAAWSETAGQIVAQLPDLAALLHAAVRALRRRGGLLVPAETGIQLTKRPDRLVAQAVGRWEQAYSGHWAYLELCTQLRLATAECCVSAEAMGVRPRLGLGGVGQNLAPASGPAWRLVERWYPLAGGKVKVQPSRPTTARSAGQQSSPRRSR